MKPNLVKILIGWNITISLIALVTVSIGVFCSRAEVTIIAAIVLFTSAMQIPVLIKLNETTN